MKNILILGATGGLARQVIPVLLAKPDIHLTLFARRSEPLAEFAAPNVRIVKGDVLDFDALCKAMAGQDLVYANLAGNLEPMADNVVKAMEKSGIKRLIWISSMGIYNETGEDHGAILQPYKRSAAIVENSGLAYTLIRPAWFTNSPEIDYQLTQKGEPFQGSQVSKRSIADLISKIIADPERYSGQSLGIGKV
ncbi:NAD(P)H-binding protein [Moraxella marmotae]|uniref:NAD(P)H-binding protein n=1 Tax=Moraxella marmotae TaxID=3344520 RepID=UPI0035F441CF